MALSGTIDPTGARRRPGAHHQLVARRRLQRALGHHARGAGGRRRELEGLQPAGRHLHAGRSSRSTASSATPSSPTSPSTRTRASALYQKAFLPAVPRATSSADVGVGHSCPRSAGSSRPLGYDEHPSSPPALGEWFTSQVLATLVSQPRGVVQDGAVPHVRRERRVLRPRAAAGPADGHARRVPHRLAAARPTPTASAGPVGMSFRVPMLVLSPFSRGGHVASEVFDHTSQLRFLEERFGVKAPNISAWRRQTAGDLTSTLHPRPRRRRRCPRCPARPTTRWPTCMAVGCTELADPQARQRTCRSTRCRSTSRCRRQERV